MAHFRCRKVEAAGKALYLPFHVPTRFPGDLLQQKPGNPEVVGDGEGVLLRVVEVVLNLSGHLSVADLEAPRASVFPTGAMDLESCVQAGTQVPFDDLERFTGNLEITGRESVAFRGYELKLLSESPPGHEPTPFVFLDEIAQLGPVVVWHHLILEVSDFTQGDEARLRTEGVWKVVARTQNGQEVRPGVIWILDRCRPSLDVGHEFAPVVLGHGDDPGLGVELVLMHPDVVCQSEEGRGLPADNLESAHCWVGLRPFMLPTSARNEPWVQFRK